MAQARSSTGLFNTCAVAALGFGLIVITGCSSTLEQGRTAAPEQEREAYAPPPPAPTPEFLTSQTAQAPKDSAAPILGGLFAMRAAPGMAIGQTYAQRENTERYPDATPNPVKVAAREPVSTFSVDVDTASYANVRRFLNDGALPPADAVRVEEMINYFDYNYAVPTDRTQPFRPAIAVYPTPWNPSTQILHIGIKGFDIPKERRPPTHLVFLIDTSGSMNSPDKLPLLKRSFRLLVDQLGADDSVAMVVYAGSAGTVLEPTRGSDKAKILAALDRLEAGGSTAGGEGIRQAYHLAKASVDKNSTTRVILATDGDFNVGITDPNALEDFVTRERASGVYLSVLGFGTGNYNDALMQKLAQAGNGNAAYIDTLNEARKVFVEQLSGVLFTIAKDVKIQVEFNPARVAEYRLIGYETRILNETDFNNDKVDAGDVGAGHSVTAMYEITPAGSEARLADPLRYGNGTQAVNGADEIAFVKIRYKLPDAEASLLLTRPVTNGDITPEISRLPADLRFAAAVAGAGQILRHDPYVKDFDLGRALQLANGARGEDAFGYRAEFVQLLRSAQSAESMAALEHRGTGEGGPQR